MNFVPAEIIKKKRNGAPLSETEISYFINGFTSGTIPEYQMSALLMAIFFQGMSETETLALTKTMLTSGQVIDFSNIKKFKVDKHSTGGVGDKTSLILGPIVAAAGLAVPMISGRGLGHTGGTLDKLESIPGFNTQLSMEAFKSAVETHGICFIGQTQDICPADKKIYSLRDVTATVESLPLICASIMSKKLAEGIDGLVLDVKYGSGAFMKTQDKAEELARALIAIAKGYGKKISALITDMNQPLGRFAGNSLEVEECLAIMKNERAMNSRGKDLYEDTKELSLKLSAKMLFLSGHYPSEAEAYAKAKNVLETGKALKKFEDLCQIHGGNLKLLPRPQYKVPIFASRSGFVHAFDTEKIGVIGIKIKAGRAVTTDVIEPTAGIEFHVKCGEQISSGDPIFSMHGADRSLLESLKVELSSALKIEDTAPTQWPLVWKEL